MEKIHLPSIAIITPCLNEELVIQTSIETLLSVLERLSRKNLINIDQSKIVVIDDGSTDESLNILKKFYDTDTKINCIKLSRNFGHQNALLSGILNSSEDIVITIDVDLQDDTNVIEEMLTKYFAGNEVVFGVKKNRSVDGFAKNFFSSIFYKILSDL